jgi:hypothetical protein
MLAVQPGDSRRRVRSELADQRGARGSTIVTEHPSSAGTAPASVPRNPAPTTTTDRAASTASRSPRTSSRPRRAWIPTSPRPIGNIRARTPVATTRPSSCTRALSDNKTSRLSRSKPRAGTPSCQSAPRPARISGKRSASRSASDSPRKTCLDSRGRS